MNGCLTVEANIDQTGRAFMQDVVMSMLDEGCVAIVPVDTTFNPELTGSYDIQTMRTGKIWNGIRNMYEFEFTTKRPGGSRML